MNRLMILGITAALFLTGPTAHADARIDAVPHVGASTEGFLRYHQDLRWRRSGLENYDKGQYDRAIVDFKRAASFGDKPSQAMLAEMYWQGMGGPPDRALAYVWMDLAAERNYRQLVSLREHYWQELGESERERALAIGKDVYAEYGDAIAVPRMNRLLNEARRNMTGSRVGSLTGPMEVTARTERGEFMRFAGDKYYRRQYWDPSLYHQWKDEFFENPFNGDVEVGELRAARVAAGQ